MALTTQINGTTSGGSSNQARASWWNDYKDVLTGVMNDQPITINYRPGVAASPTFTLKGDGFNPLLRAYDTDNTTVRATLDHSGNLTLSGSLAIGGPLSGVTTLGTSGNATVGGTLAVTGAITGSSTLAVTGNASANGFALAQLRAKGTGVTAGRNIWIAPSGTDPVTADGLGEGDLVFSF